MSSLLDALLLDPYRDPREIWIALRNDGQRGSGTASDPYDGSTAYGPALSVNLSFNDKEVIFYVFDHQYSDDDLVTISGVSGAAASYINGNHYITILSSNAFRITLSVAPPTQPYWNDLTIQSLRIAPIADDPTKKRKTTRLFWPVMLARTSVNHGYTHFEAVKIARATAVGFNGSFVAVAVTPQSLYCWMPTIPITENESGAICTRIVHRFDEVMRGLPVNSPTIVRIGPGTFETRGTAAIYAADIGYNRPESTFVGFNIQQGAFNGSFVRQGIGIRILGAGIGATTLKLVYAVDKISQTSAVSNLSAMATGNFEASDFTVDCNLHGQPIPAGSSFAHVTVGAITCGGRFNRLNRIRAIHAGPQAPPESFVLFLSGHYNDPDPVLNVIEDCIFELPGVNNVHETTLISIGGNSYLPSSRSGIVRNNFINGNFVTPGYPNGFSSEHLAISEFFENEPGYSSTFARYEFSFETKRAHHLAVGDIVKINGVVLVRAAGDAHPDDGLLPGGAHPYNGAFEVVEVVSPIKVVCRFPGTVESFGTEFPHHFPMFDGSQAYLGVDFHGPAALAGTGGVMEGNAVHDCTIPVYADTGSCRDAVVRDNYFSNVLIGLYVDFNPGLPVPENPAPNEMEPPRQAKTGLDLASLTHDGTIAIANSYSPDTPIPHGLSTGDSVEISGALIGTDPIPAAPYNRKSISITKLDDYRFSYPMTSDPGTDADPPDTDPMDPKPIRVAVYCLTRDEHNHGVAILDTGQPHGFKVGDFVRVSNTRLDSLLPFGLSYNDFVSVLDVVSPTVFKYQMESVPSQNADPASVVNPILFQSRYQIHQFIFERNICDLYLLDSNSQFTSRGISTIAYQYRQLYTFPNAVLRENIIAQVDGRQGEVLPVPGLPGFMQGSLGFVGGSFDSTILDYNLLHVSDLHPIKYIQSRNLKGSLNRTLRGSRVPVLDDFQLSGGIRGPFREQESMESEIEDAMLLAFL